MAHIGSKLRSGFFATPERQGKYIAKLLKAEGSGIWFDPTCGEGKILRQLADSVPRADDIEIQTYGVELDKGRASVAKGELTKVIQSPIEAMVISNNTFSLVFLNPPYDHTLKMDNDSTTERKEFIELNRNTRYLMEGGILIFIIPSYEFANKKIARHLATNFEECGIMSFTEEDYPQFRQCVFIGRKKKGKVKRFGEREKRLYDFLLNMESEEWVFNRVTPLDKMVGNKIWMIPEGKMEIKSFYSKLRNKNEFISGILSSKGFEIFKNRATTPDLKIGGDPILPPNQGQLALLLASGVINGELGSGHNYHLVQGMEVVETETDVEVEQLINTQKTITTERTKRIISIKVILPDGTIKKFV